VSPPAIRRVVTHGTFQLDGGSWEVDNNVWVVGGDSEVLVIDAAHDPAAIERAVAGRHVVAIVATHGHNDHIGVAPELSALLDAPVLLNPADTMLWEMTHAALPFRELRDGQVLKADGIELRAIATPGHSPGSTCLHAPVLDAVFSGDTLFQGGPGATGRSFSDFGTILASIKDKLGALPPGTAVYTGHGDTTTIGGELVDYDEWVARGH
jgi:glyoxylase-like metal-dependent hydrolase (beta-lactamase superfamily II)